MGTSRLLGIEMAAVSEKSLLVVVGIAVGATPRLFTKSASKLCVLATEVGAGMDTGATRLSLGMEVLKR
jgi:hypothetical protein